MIFDNKKKVIFLLCLSGIAGFLFSLYLHSRSTVPVRETVHYPVSFVRQLPQGPSQGRIIFREFCFACHDMSPPIEVNAPRIGDHTVWKLRQRQGMQRLLQHTIEGKGAMPARGGCFECSDKQLQAAVEYLLFNQ